MEANAKSQVILDKATQLRQEVGNEFHDALMESIYEDATRIAGRSVSFGDDKPRYDWDRTIDWLVTNKWTGFPVMFLLLAVVLWLTIEGANVPSGMLFTLFIEQIHPALHSFGEWASFPSWLSGFLFDGVYLATAWVISVMLPPMAIFFPLFTILEDFGYLPRVAFNLDPLFKRVGAHGKQALTMTMGFGCNAAGVVATRIIDSPRERLIAIITNNFSLCNGRWPTLILIGSIFVGAMIPLEATYLGFIPGSVFAGIISAGSVLFIAILGIFLMFLVSWFLSNTMLRGEVSTYSMELPPYRPPRILQTLYTSLIDRTLFVLWRAIVFAIPAGAVIWLISNLNIGDQSVAAFLIEWLRPFGLYIGLNGVILLAYIVAIPANEIVIPTILMLTVLVTGATGMGEGAGVMFELDSETATKELLIQGGWSLLTAVNLMLFCLIHNPCSTTIYTIWKETRSVKWTAVASLLPVGMGLAVCFLVAQFWRLFAAM
ncbi:ferrous iron transporter B [bacterium]|nr:ferrous iron transporter B [bacterium]